MYLISPTAKLASDDHPVLQEPNIKVLSGYTVTSIEGRELVERIRMRDPEGKEEDLELAGVFVYLHGNKPVVDFLFGALETDEDGCIPVNSMMETSIPGVFAAGDVYLYGGTARLLLQHPRDVSQPSQQRNIYIRERRSGWTGQNRLRLLFIEKAMISQCILRRVAIGIVVEIHKHVLFLLSGGP